MFKLKVQPIGAIGVREEFYARTSRDGHITIPKLLVDLLREGLEEKDSLVGYALEVTPKSAAEEKSPK